MYPDWPDVAILTPKRLPETVLKHRGEMRLSNVRALLAHYLDLISVSSSGPTTSLLFMPITWTKDNMRRKYPCEQSGHILLCTGEKYFPIRRDLSNHYYDYNNT